MKKIFVALVIIVSISACTARQQPSPSTTPAATVSPSPIAAASFTPTNTPSPTQKGLGHPYLLTETYSTQWFTLKYPKDMTLDQTSAVARLYVKGPTQKGQTEMYDGTIINFEMTPNTNKKSLDSFVKERIKNETSSEVIAQPIESKLNVYLAVKYRSRGLGEYETFVMETEDKSTFITITTLIEDPTNVGFAKLVSDILNSIVLKK